MLNPVWNVQKSQCLERPFVITLHPLYPPDIKELTDAFPSITGNHTSSTPKTPKFDRGEIPQALCLPVVMQPSEDLDTVEDCGSPDKPLESKHFRQISALEARFRPRSSEPSVGKVSCIPFILPGTSAHHKLRAEADILWSELPQGPESAWPAG